VRDSEGDETRRKDGGDREREEKRETEKIGHSGYTRNYYFQYTHTQTILSQTGYYPIKRV